MKMPRFLSLFPLPLLLVSVAIPQAPAPAPPVAPNAPHAAEISAARQAAEAWIQLLDQGKFDQAYQQLGPEAKKISQEQWREQLAATRRKYGKLDSRIFQDTDYTTTLRGAPAGQYVILDYLCTFVSHRSSPETVVMAKTGTGWKVDGFSVE